LHAVSKGAVLQKLNACFVKWDVPEKLRQRTRDYMEVTINPKP